MMTLERGSGPRVVGVLRSTLTRGTADQFTNTSSHSIFFAQQLTVITRIPLHDFTELITQELKLLTVAIHRFTGCCNVLT